MPHSGTLFGNMKQVREKKKQWPGPRLARGMAGEFGDFLDYARSLQFDETPDYERWASIFGKLSGNDAGVLDLRGYLSSNSHSPFCLLIRPSNNTLSLRREAKSGSAFMPVDGAPARHGRPARLCSAAQPFHYRR